MLSEHCCCKCWPSDRSLYCVCLLIFKVYERFFKFLYAIRHLQLPFDSCSITSGRTVSDYFFSSLFSESKCYLHFSYLNQNSGYDQGRELIHTSRLLTLRIRQSTHFPPKKHCDKTKASKGHTVPVLCRHP